MPPINSKMIQALAERLMGAKGENIIARGGGGGSPIVNPAGQQIGAIPGEPAAASNLRQARQDLQAAQGTDPLATSIQETPIPKELKMQRIQNMANKREREAPRSYMKEHWVTGFPSRADKGPADLKRTSPKDSGRLPDSSQGQFWEVIVETTGAYGQPTFATKTVKAASREDAIKRVEAEGPFTFEEVDPFTKESITSQVDPKGISDDPGYMVHAQPAESPSRSPIDSNKILGTGDEIPF